MGKKLLKDEKDVKYAGVYYNFEIFDMQEKQIPVDSVELKETVHAFSWEPVGSKFAVIHGDAQSLNVSFYGIKAGHTIVMLKKYERKTANHIFWAPMGQFVILAGLRSMNGVSWWGHKVDNAYWVWNFQGKILKRFQLERFCQFSWRPRPPCFLTNKQIREIKKNLKKWSVEFDAINKMKISEISKELLEKRQAARNKFDKYRE